MKKIILIVLIACFSNITFAQIENKTPVKKIEVTGIAEKEVTPDIIYFNISIKEYYNGKSKVSISQLEKELEKAVADAGIAKEDLTIANIYGYNYYWDQKKDPNFEARKQYRLKLSNLKSINVVLAKLDPKGVESINIDGYDHSKIEIYKKEIKIAALQAAKEKAGYLLASINEKVGPVLEIQEIDNSGAMYPMYKSTANRMMSADMAEGSTNNIEVNSIKISYQIRVVFTIQ